MPYRPRDFREFCARCDELSVTAWLRCGLPLCESHKVAGDTRCDACEQGYRDRWILGFLWVLLLSSAAPGLVIQVVDSFWRVLAVSTLVSALLFARWALGSSRARFLDERGISGESEVPACELDPCEECVVWAQKRGGLIGALGLTTILFVPAGVYGHVAPAVAFTIVALGNAATAATTLAFLRVSRRRSRQCAQRRPRETPTTET